MKEWADIINQVGVPVGSLIFLAWGATKVFQWLGHRLDNVGAFLAPLFSRLVEATEANTRFMESLTHQVTHLNERHTWHHETVFGAIDQARQLAEEAATNTRQILEQLNTRPPSPAPGRNGTGQGAADSREGRRETA
ncbi:hypothetical protein D3C72_737200 [compost metagenome]